MQAGRKTTLDSGNEEETSRLRKETCQCRHRDTEKGAFFGQIFSTAVCVQRYRVWRPVGARYEEKYTITTIKHPPIQVCWKAMSFMRPAGHRFLPPETTMRVKNTLTCYIASLNSS